jgi:hypothetical protein
MNFVQFNKYLQDNKDDEIDDPKIKELVRKVRACAEINRSKWDLFLAISGDDSDDDSDDDSNSKVEINPFQTPLINKFLKLNLNN